MDCKLLGLQRNPFGESCDESPFYRSPDREKILEKMKAAGRGAGVMVLVGEAGVGKTALVREFLRRLDPACRTALVSCVEKTGDELIRHVQTARNLKVLVLDSAEQLSPEGFQQVETLSRARSSPADSLPIVLVGRPELLQSLRDARARGLRERISLTERIDPWSESQTADYLRHRIRAAGGDVGELFTREAIALISRYAEGFPGAVHRIGSAALEAAIQTGTSRITAELVVNANRDRLRDPSRVPPTPPPGDADSRIRSAGIEDWTDELPAPTEQAMDEAGVATQRLSNVADRLGAATESVQDKVLLLATGLQTAEDVYRRLDQLSRDVTGQACGFEKAADARLAQLRQAIDECKRALEDAGRVREAIATESDRRRAAVLDQSKVAEDSLNRHAEAARRIEAQLVRVRQECEQRSERASETLGRLESATQHAAAGQKQLQSLMDRLDAARDQTEDLLGATDQTLHQREECLQNLARTIDEMAQHTIRTAESAKTEVAETAKAAQTLGRQAADHAKSDVQAAEDKLRETEQAVQQQIGTLRSAIDGMAKDAIRTVETAKADVQEAAKAALVVGRQAVDGLLGNVRRAVEEADQAADNTKSDVQAAADKLRETELAVHQQAGAVREAVEQARQSRETLAIDVGAADAKGEQLASHISAANDVATRLTEANAQSQRVMAELGQREASLGRLGETLTTLVRRGTEKVGAAGEQACSRLTEATEAMKKEVAAGEQHTESLRRCNDEAGGTLKRLTLVSDRARNDTQTLEQTIRQVREVDESAQVQAETLARHRDQTAAAAERLEASSAAARACSQDVVAQTEAARTVAAEQQELCDRAHDRTTELAERIERGGQTAERLATLRDGAIELENRLQARVEQTESVLERLAGLVDRLDRRQEEIAAQDQALRRLGDDREGLELRLQRAGDTVESLRLELSALLAEPQRMVCKAQAQALKLHDACRVTQEICGKLSRASVDAGRRIEQLNRLEATADALKCWVDETVRAQQRLSAALGTPAPPSPEARAQGRLITPATARREPAAVAVASSSSPARGPAVTPRQPASAPNDAERKKDQARRIDRLIRDARQEADSRSAAAPVGAK